MPEGFHGQRKSFTVPVPNCDTTAGILWYEGSIYVNKSRGNGYPIDGKGGTTLNTRKIGSWKLTWEQAHVCAGHGLDR